MAAPMESRPPLCSLLNCSTKTTGKNQAMEIAG